MSLDQACIAVVALAAVAGAFLGALSQGAQLGAMAAGWAGARLLGPGVASLLHGAVPAFAARPLGGALAFVGSAAAARLALRGLLGLAGAGGARQRGGWDRATGAVLGAAQAGVFLWVALSALAAWGRPIHVGPIDVDPTRSDMVALAAEHDALARARTTIRKAPAPEARDRR